VIAIGSHGRNRVCEKPPITSLNFLHSLHVGRNLGAARRIERRPA
jgi:hypothetical protein